MYGSILRLSDQNTTLSASFSKAVGAGSTQVGSDIPMLVAGRPAQFIQVYIISLTLPTGPGGTAAVKIVNKDSLGGTTFPYIIDTPGANAAATSVTIATASAGTELVCYAGRTIQGEPLLASKVGVYIDGTNITGTGSATFAVYYTLWG